MLAQKAYCSFFHFFHYRLSILAQPWGLPRRSQPPQRYPGSGSTRYPGETLEALWHLVLDMAGAILSSSMLLAFCFLHVYPTVSVSILTWASSLLEIVIAVLGCYCSRLIKGIILQWGRGYVSRTFRSAHAENHKQLESEWSDEEAPAAPAREAGPVRGPCQVDEVRGRILNKTRTRDCGYSPRAFQRLWHGRPHTISLFCPTLANRLGAGGFPARHVLNRKRMRWNQARDGQQVTTRALVASCSVLYCTSGCI